MDAFRSRQVLGLFDEMQHVRSPRRQQGFRMNCWQPSSRVAHLVDGKAIALAGPRPQPPATWPYQGARRLWGASSDMFLSKHKINCAVS
jgi:hypothetical protein